MSLSFLNEEQRLAVEQTDGAVLVFAGAGSGKTRVLTHRIVHLIEQKNVRDWNILAITFTNKATREMKTRLNDMLGDNDVWVSTFHALCTKILYKHADKIGYGKNFSIYDEQASKKLLQQVLREKDLYEDKESDKKTFKYANHISNAKNKGKMVDEYQTVLKQTKIDRDEIDIICEVYERYDELLRINNAMDFDDLLIRTKQLLEASEEVREYYQNKFRYIHVDEFQDTNAVQLDLITLLGDKHKNIFVVGDDDQSIYSWRGAEIDNILNFDKNFENAKVFKLQENYRSTQNILNCANNLIKNNINRKEKQLFTNKKGGVKIEYLLNGSEYNEVDRIIDIIRSLKRIDGYYNSDFAILVRNNSLTRLFEINLNKVGIDYNVYGGFKFFDRKEVQDIIAYFRLIFNPKDGDALARIYNFPKRGIGNSTFEAVKDYAQQKYMHIYDVIMNIENEQLSNAIKNKIIPFKQLMTELNYESIELDLFDFAVSLVKKLDLENLYSSSDKPEDATRMENINELLKHIKENFSYPNASLEDFLQTISLNKEASETKQDADNLVLATMHAAKGLEFKVVFIVACEEGIIPSKMCFNELNGIEEERRVMYVALTRAEERLYISCVNGFRTRFNNYTERALPSRFIAETKDIQLKINHDNDYYNNKYEQDYYSLNIPKGYQMSDNMEYKVNTTVQQPKKIYNKDSNGFVSGAKVKHARYGEGTIIIVEGKDSGTAVTVTFPNLGLKKFALQNAPLTLI